MVIQPLIVLVFSWYGSNFSFDYLKSELSYAEDMSGFDSLPQFAKSDKLIGIATTAQRCIDGLYLGQKPLANNLASCTQLCSAANSDEYEYKFIESNNIVVNNRYLQRGSWCLPSSLARCNLNISRAVKSAGHYECISKHPKLLGGKFGNNIVGCSPNFSFKDNLLNIIYTNIVPSSLIIYDIDEKLSDGSYRYTCNHDNTFVNAEEMPKLGNRFTLLYNSCGFYDKNGKLQNYKCKCSTDLNDSQLRARVTASDDSHIKSFLSITDDMHIACSTCNSGFGVQSVDEAIVPAFNHGVTIGINCVDPKYIEYYKTSNMQYNGMLPCGLKKLAKIRNSPNPPKYACHRALVNATNSYSPEMLGILDSLSAVN